MTATMTLKKGERAALLEAHGNVCDHCHKPHSRLHAHHTSYSKMPTVVLCPPCHGKEHAKIGSVPRPKGAPIPLYTFIPKPLSAKIKAAARKHKVTKRSIIESGIELRLAELAALQDHIRATLAQQAEQE